MSTHELKNTNHAAVREQYPDAAIIRRLDQGHYVVFDQPHDAIGHPSATRQPVQQS